MAWGQVGKGQGTGVSLRVHLSSCHISSLTHVPLVRVHWYQWHDRHCAPRRETSVRTLPFQWGDGAARVCYVRVTLPSENLELFCVTVILYALEKLKKVVVV